MSIINDALKKTQLNLKKPTKPLKTQDKPKPQSGQNITNVYEKMYKAREEQKNASVSQNVRGKMASPIVSSPPQAKKWVKTLLIVIFFSLILTGIFYLLKSYLPHKGFFSSHKQNKTSSRFRISNAAPERVYKTGDLVLNGISFIDGRNVALINDEIYEVGDSIDGKKITSIGLNKVELRDDEKIVTIKVR